MNSMLRLEVLAMAGLALAAGWRLSSLSEQ